MIGWKTENQALVETTNTPTCCHGGWKECSVPKTSFLLGGAPLLLLPFDYMDHLLALLLLHLVPSMSFWGAIFLDGRPCLLRQRSSRIIQRSSMNIAKQ